MDNIPFYIVTSDPTSHILPAVCHLYNKYWLTGERQKFTILGQTKPAVDLPDNFEFVKIKDDNNVQHWTRHLYNYVRDHVVSDYFVLTLDDYMPNSSLKPEILDGLLSYARQKGNVGRIALYAPTTPQYDVVEQRDGYSIFSLHQDAASKIACQTSVWNREYFLKYFSNDWTPWELELKGSELAKKDEMQIIGALNDVAFDWVHESALSGRWPGMVNILGMQSEDVKELLNLNMFKEDQLQYGMWTEARVPLFSEVGYNFSFGLVKDRLHPVTFESIHSHYKSIHTYEPEDASSGLKESAALTHRGLSNSTYSFLGYSLPIVFAIVVTPILVRRLGSNLYGIYILVNTVMGFLNLIDLGVGQAILKFLSAHVGSKNNYRLQRIFTAGNFMFWVFGALGALTFLVIGAFFLPFFKISPQAIPHVREVFLLAGLVFLVNSLAIVPANALRALQRYDLTVKISLAYVSLNSLLSLGVVLMGMQLKAVLSVNLFSALIAFGALLYFVRKNYPGVKYLSAGFLGEEVRQFYRFGGAVFVTNIANNMLSQFDRLFIPSYYNPTQLAYYAVPGNVAEKINGVAGSSTGFLFPMLSTLVASGEGQRGKVIYQRVIRNVLVFAVALAVIASLFSSQILRYWVGESYAINGAYILVVLSFTNAILAFYSVMQNMLLGMGQIRFLMKQSLIMAGVNVILLFYLLPRYGIRGAAWAYLLSVLPALVSVAIAEKRFFELSDRLVFYSKLAAKLAVVSGIVAVLYYSVVQKFVTGMLTLIVAGGAMFLLFMGLYALFGFFEEEDLAAYKNFLGAVKKKILK